MTFIIELRPEAKVTVTKKQFATLFNPKCIRTPNFGFLCKRYTPDTIILELRPGVNLILCSNVDQDTYGKEKQKTQHSREPVGQHFPSR